jgi:hypothetical protein
VTRREGGVAVDVDISSSVMLGWESVVGVDDEMISGGGD